MASGSFDLTRNSGTQYVKVWLEWNTNSDVSSNTSFINVTMKAKRTNTGYTTSGTGIFKININGAETSVNKKYSITSNEVILMTATQNVQHNSDGTKTINISGEYNGDTPISGSGNQDITLDNIARASSFTLSASSIEMNEALTITINRANSNFVHQVFYHFGSKTWQVISGNASTNCSWTVPLSLANEIPNATSGVCTIIVETYKGTVNSNNYIGTTSKTITLTVPASVIPTISSVNLVEATANLASQFGVYVQNHSTIKGTITATGANGSKISNYKTVINGSTYSSSTFTTAVLKTTGTNTAKVTVTDSRGRTATKNVTFNVVAYTDPKISTFNVERNDTTPTTVAVKIKASIKDVNSKNTYSYTIKYKKTSASTYTSKTVTGTTSVDKTVNITGIDENATYDFRLEVKDYFKTIIATQGLSTAFTLMNFNASGKGMGLGKVSEKDALEIGFDTYFYEKIFNSNGDEISELIDNLKKAIETIEGKIEKTLWKNSSGTLISVNNGTSKSLSSMPNLSQYSGKNVNIYIGYDTDEIKKFTFNVNNSKHTFFIDYVKNYNGPDIWHTLFNIENEFTTTWKVGISNSYVIADTNITKVDIGTTYKFYLYKITISD